MCVWSCVYVKWFDAWVGLSLGWLVVGGPFCIGTLVVLQTPKKLGNGHVAGKTGKHQVAAVQLNDVFLVAIVPLQSAHHLLCPSSTFLALLTPAELKPFSADSSPRTVLSRAPLNSNPSSRPSPRLRAGVPAVWTQTSCFLTDKFDTYLFSCALPSPRKRQWSKPAP